MFNKKEIYWFLWVLFVSSGLILMDLCGILTEAILFLIILLGAFSPTILLPMFLIWVNYYCYNNIFCNNEYWVSMADIVLCMFLPIIFKRTDMCGAIIKIITRIILVAAPIFSFAGGIICASYKPTYAFILYALSFASTFFVLRATKGDVQIVKRGRYPVFLAGHFVLVLILSILYVNKLPDLPDLSIATGKEEMINAMTYLTAPPYDPDIAYEYKKIDELPTKIITYRPDGFMSDSISIVRYEGISQSMFNSMQNIDPGSATNDVDETIHRLKADIEALGVERQMNRLDCLNEAKIELAPRGWWEIDEINISNARYMNFGYGSSGVLFYSAINEVLYTYYLRRDD